MVEGETVRAEAGTPKAESAISVVLGASGGIGNVLVRELAGRGLRVRAVSRDGHARVPDGVESCAADLTTADGAARACAEAAVVYHAVQPRYDRWAEEFPALNESIVTAATRAGAKLVCADNLYMYGPVTGPINEQCPQQPSSRKGRVRKGLAESLLAAPGANGLLNMRTGELSYCSAGHNPPYVLRASGALEAITETGGVPLGLFDHMGYTGSCAQLAPGDALFLYTDGVPEANNDALEEFTYERLAASLRDSRSLACREMIDRLTGELLAFTAGAPQSDDITMLSIRRRP